MKLFFIYLAIMNVFGFLLMGMDKKRAASNGRQRRQFWRIPEKHLFLCSAMGGCLGTWIGMYVFRHKTRHWYFVVGMPAIAALWAVLLFVLWEKGFIA